MGPTLALRYARGQRLSEHLIKLLERTRAISLALGAHQARQRLKLGRAARAHARERRKLFLRDSGPDSVQIKFPSRILERRRAKSEVGNRAKRVDVSALVDLAV